MTQPVHVIATHRFDVAAERVFDACLDPAWVGRWMFGPNARDEHIVRLTLEARVGGKYSVVVNRAGADIEYVGEYLEIDRPQLLVFTWAPRDRLSDPSRVIIEFTPRPEGCDVKLTQVIGASWSTNIDLTADVWSRRLDALSRAIAQEMDALSA